MRGSALLLLAATAVADVSNSRPITRWIVYTRHQESSEAHELWLIQGGHERQIAKTPGSGWPRLSPDGTRVALAIERNGRQLVVIDLKSRAVTPLTTQGAGDECCWSPEGRRIAYVLDNTLHVVGADGRGDRILCDQIHPEAVAWSPTSRLLAIGGPEGLHVIRPDGSGLERISAEWGHDLSFARDGKRIAYERDSKIYAVDLETRRTKLLSPHEVEDHSPRFSPDGKRIAFYSRRDGNCEVYVMDADGSNPVRLTDSPGYDEQPRWSSDGRWILFASTRDGDYDLFIVRPDGSGLRRMTNNPGTDYLYDW